MNNESPHKYSSFIDLIDSPRELFDKLDGIHGTWYLAGKKGRPESDLIIAQLNNQCGINMIASAIEAMKEGESPFDIMDLVNPVLPKLIVEPNDIIGLWKELYNRTTNDMASGRQYDEISNLLKQKPNIKGELFSLLNQANEPFTIGYLSEMRLALSKDSFTSEFDELMTMTESKNEFEVIAAINALSRLKYSGKKNPLITKVLKRYEEIEKHAASEVLFALVHSHGHLLSQRATIAKKLVTFLDYDIPEIDFALSKILFLNRGDWEQKGWYKKIFMGLDRTSTKNKGIIDNLDYVAQRFMKTETGIMLVEDFLLNWLDKSDYSKKEMRFEKLFNSVAHDYLRRRDDLERLVTKLFNSDNFSAHSLASELVAYNSLHKQPPLEFCKKLIKSYSSADIVYITRKVISNVYQCNEAASFVYSLLNKGPTNKGVQALVYEVMTDIIGPNYLASTIKFIEAKKAKTKAKSRIELCNRIIEELQSDIRELDALPPLEECCVPSSRTYIAQLGHQKVMRKSMDEASEGSLASMFTKVSLKYGRGSFFSVNNEISSPTPMVTHSTSMELPRSEVHHPVYAAMERVNFKFCKRGK